MTEEQEQLYIYHPIFGAWPISPYEPEHLVAELVEAHPAFNIFFARPTDAFWDR